MSDFDVENHVCYQLLNAPLRLWPFPHFYAENVFPYEFYRNLRQKIDEKVEFHVGERDYHGRTFASVTPDLGADFMRKEPFLRLMCAIFGSQLAKAYQQRKFSVFTDLRLVRDGKDYHIGPHTDAPWKIASFLFYLPDDGWHLKHGTSIYTPKDPTFTCEGGPHHPFDNFLRVATMPYVPNTCLGFLKTNQSFHGVEPIFTEFKRDVLLFNIYDEALYLQSHKHLPSE